MASAPRYEAAVFQDKDAFQKLVNDPAAPLVNRAIAGAYPMGSTFKAVTATAAMEEGVLTPETPLTCEGILHEGSSHPRHCLSRYGHGTITLRTAVQKSCNIFFWKTAELLGRTDRGLDSRLALDRLRPDSTVTRDRRLAEAFSHKPTIVSVEDDGRIRHNGTAPGHLYRVAEELLPGDLQPHPRTTMAPGQEWLTTRELALEWLGPVEIGERERLTGDHIARLRRRL